MSASGPSGPLVLSSADFFHNQFFGKILSGIPTECQTDWIQVSNRLDPDQARRFVGPDLGQICLQRH